MSNKRDNSIKDCFKVRKGLCVDGDSTMSGGLTASGIDIIAALSRLADIDHEHDHEHDGTGTGIPPELLSIIQEASACWEYPGYDMDTTTLLQTASAYYKQSELNNTIKYLHDVPLSLNIPESFVIEAPGDVPVSFALSANDTYAFEIDKSTIDFAEEENFEIEFMIYRLSETNHKVNDLIGESQHFSQFENQMYRIIWNGNAPTADYPSPGNSVYGVRFIHDQQNQNLDGGPIPLETWTNVKITRENGDTLKMYYDDVEVASDSGVTKALPVVAPPLSNKVKIFGGWSGGYAAPNLLLRELKVTKIGPDATTCTINNHDYPPLNGAPALIDVPSAETGKYTGDGSASGQVVELGYRPHRVTVYNEARENSGLNCNHCGYMTIRDGDNLIGSKRYMDSDIENPWTNTLDTDTSGNPRGHIEITDTGFIAYGTSNDSVFNYSGQKYVYDVLGYECGYTRYSDTQAVYAVIPSYLHGNSKTVSLQYRPIGGNNQTQNGGYVMSIGNNDHYVALRVYNGNFMFTIGNPGVWGAYIGTGVTPVEGRWHDISFKYGSTKDEIELSIDGVRYTIADKVGVPSNSSDTMPAIDATSRLSINSVYSGTTTGNGGDYKNIKIHEGQATDITAIDPADTSVPAGCSALLYNSPTGYGNDDTEGLLPYIVKDTPGCPEKPFDTGTNRILHAQASTSNEDGDGISTRTNEVVPYFYGDGTKDWAADAQFVGSPVNNHSVTPFVSGSSYGDSSMYFNGISYIKWEQDAYVRDTFFNIGNSDFTYELWFRADNIYDRQPLFSSHDQDGGTGNDAILCELHSPTNLYFQNIRFHFRRNDGEAVEEVNIPIEPREWYHLAVVRKDNMLHVYVNGKLENTPVAWAGQPRTNNTAGEELPFLIGRYWTKRFKGHIQDFRYTQEAVYTQNFQECLTSPPDVTTTLHYSPTGTVVAQYAECAPESTGGAGGSGVFVTDITSDGITNKTNDGTQVAIGNYAPVVSAVVDDPNLHFTVEWEGASDEWTGYPTVSGHKILKTETSAIAGDQTIRRFRAVKSIDFGDYKGETITIPIEFKGSSYSVDVEIAGVGPVAESITCDLTYPHGQDHFKSGDELTLTITFDTPDVQSVTVHSGSNLATKSETYTSLSFESSTIINGKRVIVLKTPLDGAAFTTNILKNLDVKVTAANSLGTIGAEYTESAIVPSMLGPVITNITFDTNPYPGNQTELKNGDTVNVHFTFDTNNVNRLYFSNSENTTNNLYKSINTNNKTGSVSVAITTSHASDTSTFAKPVKVKASSTAGGYTFGDFKVSTDTINVNNQYPQVINNGVTYPGGQNGIKSGEIAQVSLEARYVGTSPSYLYSHPTSQLKVPPVIGGPGSGDGSHANDVYALPKRVEYNSGDYNISTPNMNLTVTRKENGASTTGTAVVNIANVSPTITVTSNSGNRMRSGGNDGTSAQNYSVRIDSDQQLTNTPSIVVPVGSIGSWSANSQKTRYTATISVHDNDTKGTHTYTGMNATGITGLSTNVISSGADYVFGGFVSRVVDISAPGQADAYINVLWSDYSKLSLTWSTGVALPTRSPAGTTNQITGAWAVVSQTAPDTGTTPVEVRILDYSATGAISTPTTVTIEEDV